MKPLRERIAEATKDFGELFDKIEKLEAWTGYSER